MEAQISFNLASQAVSDAVAFDNKHNYREAHTLYLKAVSLFEDSMDVELNETKLNVLKNRIAAYKKRASELDAFFKTQKDDSPVRINELELEMGVKTNAVMTVSPVINTSNEARLERIVIGLGVLVGVLLVAVVGVFTMLQIHITENSDLNSDMELTQARLNTVAESVLRFSSSPSEVSGQGIFNDLENMNSGSTMDYTAQIEEVKLGLASVNVQLNSKSDLSAVYTVESIDSLLESKAESVTVLELSNLIITKVDAVDVYNKFEIDAVLTEVDLRLSSEVSGLSGAMHDLASTMGVLNQDLKTLETTSVDALHDVEASFSGIFLDLHEDVQALESTVELKANIGNVHTNHQTLRSVINVVKVLSGTTMDDDTAETFFTDQANLEIDLSISAVDFALFEETIIEDLAEVQEEVDSLEINMDLKADAEVVASIEEQIVGVVTSLDTKVGENEVSDMIAVAVGELNIADILASIADAVEAAANVDYKVDALDDIVNVNDAAYNVKFVNLDNKIDDVGDAITPLTCSWTGNREIFADNEGCRDDLIITCSGGVVTRLHMRCGN